MTALWLKFFHLLGVVLMLGNVIVTGFWNFKAVRSRHLAVIAFAQREVMWADAVLTLVGGTMITISGIMLAMDRGYPFWATRWLNGGVFLLGLSTLLWLGVLLPCQDRLIKLSREALSTGTLSPRFAPVFVVWNVVGWFATFLLVGALGLMVVKPL
ncbi:hypothetical protein D3C86_1262840 [compost metagenome]